SGWVSRRTQRHHAWVKTHRHLFTGSDAISAESFLDLLDGQAVGLIVWLVMPVVVALKSKQLVSVAFSNHLEVDAPLHPSFSTRNVLVQPKTQSLTERAASVILF